jgi:hypothetical protein
LEVVVVVVVVLCLRLALWLCLAPLLEFDGGDSPPGCDEDFCGDDDVGWGVVWAGVVLDGVLDREGEVEVELEVELLDDDVELDDAELDDDDELLLELLLELLDAGAVVEVVLSLADDDEEDAGAHDIDELATTPLIGRLSWERGVPGGTLTLNVSVAPPMSVTVTVQASADATGTKAVARTASTAATAPRSPRSLRRVLTVVRPVLPPSVCASHPSKSAAHRAVRDGTLLTRPEVCNFEVARSSEAGFTRVGKARVTAATLASAGSGANSPVIRMVSSSG